MKLTEKLVAEHDEIRKVLNVVRKIADNLRISKTFYTDDVDTVCNYILTYWDLSHCQKEEKILYPALLNEGLITERENVNQVLQEHKFGRNYLNEIKGVIETCKIGQAFSAEKLSEILSKYIDMILEHMDKEEKYYFTLADKVIKSDKQNFLLKESELIDNNLVKQQTFKQYKQKYQALASKYMV